MMDNTKSYQLFQKAKEIMPGGITANIKNFSPYPIFMKSGKGAYLTDVDNNEYIDYLLSYSALMLGHGHPKIKDTIENHVQEFGTWLYGTPSEIEIEFGKMIQHYYPSIELLRYTNSGTEATLLAIRLAFAYTGKHKIAKFEGHYHGGHRQVLFSIAPPMSEAGDVTHPNTVPNSKELASKDQEQTIILPFNDLEHAEEILKANQDQIAALVMEPIQDGFLPVDQSFINGIRQITQKLGIVLIFDEVKTGFRVSMGGAQSLYNIEPDLTTLGKTVGGGFPIGVVGGKKDILMQSAPANHQSDWKAMDTLFHSGTYNGHPLILAAGMTTVKILEQEINDVFKRADVLKKELEKLFFEKGIAMQAMGIGSMFNIILTDQPLSNYRDFMLSDIELRKRIDLHLLDEGIYVKPGNRYSLSTMHGEQEIEKTLDAYKKVLSKTLVSTS